MTPTAGATNRRGPSPLVAPRRRTALVVAAVAALLTLLAVDSLNLLQAPDWVDLTQGPYMAAVRQARAVTAAPAAGDRAPHRPGATLPGAPQVAVAVLVLVVVLLEAPLVAPRRAWSSRSTRAPPSPRLLRSARP